MEETKDISDFCDLQLKALADFKIQTIEDFQLKISEIEGKYYTYTGDKAEGIMLKLYRLKPKIGQRKANVGNTQLLPYVSDNIDVAYENYYAEGSYVAVNVFHKVYPFRDCGYF